MRYNNRVIQKEYGDIVPVNPPEVFTDALEGTVIDCYPEQKKRNTDPINHNNINPLLQALQTQYNDTIEQIDFYTSQASDIDSHSLMTVKLKEKQLRLYAKASSLTVKAEKIKLQIVKLEGKYN